MHYISTRGLSEERSFMEILLEGLAPDGGLYVPEGYPKVSSIELEKMRSMSYAQLAYTILQKFADDIPSNDLRAMVDQTYTADIFGSEHITPLKKLDDGLCLLGLSEGPTLAFKDLALQLLGRLFEYALNQRGDELNILGATSGDTGSAAEYAMRGRKGIRVFMLSPHDRMSEFQRRQMYTLQDVNIFNIAIRGVFDDCQDVVKKVNEDGVFKSKYNLGAVNSINWARIAAQAVYYAYGYFRATNSNDEVVDFAVPTGNFGNILAGSVAKQMGIPIRRLILATNENDVLAEFFKTGMYRPRSTKEVATTSSPSMDISKASNFERYVYDLVHRDAVRMSELWKNVQDRGSFDISNSPDWGAIPETGIVAGSSTHQDRLHTIRAIYKTYGVMIDPHTADGMRVGLEKWEKGVSLVCLETAKPSKFSATIKEALGIEPEIPDPFKELPKLPERFDVLDADAESIKRYIRKKVG